MQDPLQSFADQPPPPNAVAAMPMRRASTPKLLLSTISVHKYVPDQGLIDKLVPPNCDVAPQLSMEAHDGRRGSPEPA